MNLGDVIRDAMTTLGYPGLALLVALENLFPPIPSEVVLPLAGFFVERGEFRFLAALAASTAGSVGGALVLYWMAHFGGRRAILRYERFLRVGEDDLARLEDGFRRNGVLYVAVARLVPGLRSAVSVPAGIVRMPLPLFIALTTVGSAAWNAALIGAGWALGTQYHAVGDVIGPVSGVIVAVAAAAGAWWYLRHRRRRRPDATDA